jgi:hypothetical protein
MLSQYLAEVPHHYWDAKAQVFIAELKSEGATVQRYTIPRAVFFAIHADMARAIRDASEAVVPPPLPLKKGRKPKAESRVVAFIKREAEGH